MERKHGRSRVWIGVKWSSGLDLASVRKEWNFGRGVKGREKGGHIVDHPCLSSWGFHWLGLAGIIKKDSNLELGEGKGSHLLLPQNGFERLPKLWQDDEAICNSFHANGANQQFSLQPSGAIQSGVFLFRWLLIHHDQGKTNQNTHTIWLFSKYQMETLVCSHSFSLECSIKMCKRRSTARESESYLTPRIQKKRRHV